MNKFISILFSIFFLSACLGGGGGSSSQAKVRISGVLRNFQGTSVSGTVVTVLDTGDFITTDAQGNFAIDTPLLQDNFDLLFEGIVEGKNINSVVKISGLGKDLIAVELSLRIKADKLTIELLSLKTKTSPKPSTDESTDDEDMLDDDTSADDDIEDDEGMVDDISEPEEDDSEDIIDDNIDDSEDESNDVSDVEDMSDIDNADGEDDKQQDSPTDNSLNT